jgi:hypothetical protein
MTITTVLRNARLIDTQVHSTLVSDIDLSLFLATGVTTAHDVDGQIDKVPPCASV